MEKEMTVELEIDTPQYEEPSRVKVWVCKNCGKIKMKFSGIKVKARRGMSGGFYDAEPFMKILNEEEYEKICNSIEEDFWNSKGEDKRSWGTSLKIAVIEPKRAHAVSSRQFEKTPEWFNKIFETIGKIAGRDFTDIKKYD